MKTLILGIGNALLKDEGVGIHVIRALTEETPDAGEVEYMDGGTLSFTLAGPICEAKRLIVVDAAQLQAPPGTVRLFLGEAMDAFIGSNRKASVHEVGLADLMAIARLTGGWPPLRALVAIQPREVDWGEQLSPEVLAAVPEACRLIREQLESWCHGA